jgi:TatD DNase family protein
MWIDTHAHLNDDRFADDLPGVLERARAAGAERVLVIGIDRATSQRAVELAEAHGEIFAVVGIQPNSLNELQADDWDVVRRLAEHPRSCGVGETGLDRYWKTVPIELQQEWFRLHLELAHRLQKPVVIHCREAEADVVAALRAFSDSTGEAIQGVMHSFTGDVATAQACLKLGLHLSFAGMVTYKKNDALRQVAAATPLDRLLVETDSPYLSPEPVRGRTNEPANVRHTGACLAKVLGVSVEELAAATTANARRLFHLS